ncbi:decarboxylase [Streptomyces sp. enrichment culture]|uniref:aspartate racemase/maleate isomerase family protein n=1 Tax=Streptomyces sp. enrichment culture TaxID=1795815 RepID=UPI003F54513A
MTALGILHAGHAAKDDYPRIEQLLGSDVRVDVVHADVDDPERLAAGGEQLRLTGAEAVVWTGSVDGSVPAWEDAHARIRALAQAAGMPASFTPFAFVHAAREIEARRVAVATPGTSEAAGQLAAFLRAGGLEVTSVHAGQAPTWDERQLLTLVRAADTPEADAVLVPGASLSTVAHLPALEESLGKPVLTASQVTVWEALRLTDRRVNAPRLGALFTREPIVQV